MDGPTLVSMYIQCPRNPNIQKHTLHLKLVCSVFVEYEKNKYEMEKYDQGNSVSEEILQAFSEGVYGFHSSHAFIFHFQFS